MIKSERELWQKYFETPGRKKQLEKFLQTLKKPDEKYKEELKAYEELVRGVYSKIFSLLSAARLMKKSIEDIRRRIEEPEFRNNILIVTPQILQADTLAGKMLKRASEQLDKTVDELSDANFLIVKRLFLQNNEEMASNQVHVSFRRCYQRFLSNRNIIRRRLSLLTS